MDNLLVINLINCDFCLWSGELKRQHVREMRSRIKKAVGNNVKILESNEIRRKVMKVGRSPINVPTLISEKFLRPKNPNQLENLPKTSSVTKIWGYLI